MNIFHACNGIIMVTHLVSKYQHEILGNDVSSSVEYQEI
jgi:hypothetical protein